MGKIPVSIGILTFNSGKTLARTLESVQECAEVIVSDGGSTDGTLDIARRYGVRLIAQSDPGRPIMDFALERNRLLDAATQEWFFYLDSDEVASPELIEAMRRATENPSGPKVYQVRYQVTNPDLSIKYRTAVPYYQPRFFSTRTGGRFIKKVHEKVWWESERPKEGKIEAPWYVPLDVQLDFAIYKAKVHHRLPLMVAEWKPGFVGAIRKGIVEPIVTVLKSIIKIVYLRLRYPWSELVPLRYELYRMYSQWVITVCVWKRWTASIIDRETREAVRKL